MFNFTGGTLTLTNSTVSGNSASRGGGVYNIGTANFANSIISENSASLIGGGILTFGRLTLKNSIISGNFSNSTGGLLIGSENTILINCTLSGNSSEGVFINGGTATFTNTIVATNDQDIFLSAATIIDGGNNLIGNGTGQNVLVNGTNGNQVGTTGSEIDPLFIKDVPSTATMPSSGGDLRLACGSPAIDAGSNASAMGTSDLNGYPRIADGSGNGTMTVDIGAHERVTFTTNHIVTTTADKGPGSLRDLATAACPGDTITFDMAIDGMPIMLTSGEITLNKNLVILGNPAAGSGQAPKTIIDGQANSRIFSITSGDTVTIDGVTLQNGEALGMFFPDDRGGAIVNDGVLNIFNSHLSHNTARFGGAIINQGTGVLEVSNSTITENTAVIQGGGVLSFGTVGIKKNFRDQ